MLRAAAVLLLALSSLAALVSGLRGSVRQRQRLDSLLTRDRGGDFPVLQHQQILDHFDATNPRYVHIIGFLSSNNI